MWTFRYSGHGAGCPALGACDSIIDDAVAIADSDWIHHVPASTSA
jgi:hypothetical protein